MRINLCLKGINDQDHGGFGGVSSFHPLSSGCPHATCMDLRVRWATLSGLHFRVAGHLESVSITYRSCLSALKMDAPGV